MASILDSVVQPVWMVDQAGLIRFAKAGGTVLRALIPLAHDWAGDAGVVL